MEFGTDENMKPNESLDELLQFLKNSIHNCGYLDEDYIGHYGENYEWYTEIDFPFFIAYYYDEANGKNNLQYAIFRISLKSHIFIW